MTDLSGGDHDADLPEPPNVSASRSRDRIGALTHWLRVYGLADGPCPAGCWVCAKERGDAREVVA